MGLLFYAARTGTDELGGIEDPKCDGVVLSMRSVSFSIGCKENT
jgi:hypothetical protein